MSDTPAASQPEIVDQAAFRAKLGMRLVFWSTLSIVLLAITIMGAAGFTTWKTGDSDPVMESAHLLLTTLLPLFGTWVGTVLAFFYSKENFEAASRNTLAMVRTTSQTLAETLVSATMIETWKIRCLRLPPDGTLAAVTVADMTKAFEQAIDGKPITRLPILDASGRCKAIIHRSIWLEMQLAASRAAAPDAAPDPTLAPLLALPRPTTLGATFGDLVAKSFIAIAPERFLAEAKASMEREALYQDLIVTRGGRLDEPLVGWLTNIAIARASRA